MIKTYITIVILTVIMLGAVVYGISESGSPFETRNKIIDQQRVSDISSLSSAMENYYSQNNRLPDQSENIRGVLYGVNNLIDPETQKNYEYIKSGPTEYKLCANFSTDTTNTDKNSYTTYSYTNNNKYKHPKGHFCFDLSVASVSTKKVAS